MSTPASPRRLPHLDDLRTAPVAWVIALGVAGLRHGRTCRLLLGGARRAAPAAGLRLAVVRARRRAAAWSHGAYAAFVIPGPVLTALASAMRPPDAPAGLKAIGLSFRLRARVSFLSGPTHPGPRPAAVAS